MPKIKDPDARLDYFVDWTTFLASVDGDTIAAAEWVPRDDDLTIEDEQVDGENRHFCFASGGTVGRGYRVTSRIVTAAGREQDQSFDLYIREG